MNKLSQFVRRCEGCANPPRAENAEIAEPFKELDDHVSGRGETTCAVNACCGVGHHENESEECAPLPKPVFARIFASPSYRKEQEPFHQSAFYGPCIQRDSGAYSVSCREKVPNVRSLRSTSLEACGIQKPRTWSRTRCALIARPHDCGNKSRSWQNSCRFL